MRSRVWVGGLALAWAATGLWSTPPVSKPIPPRAAASTPTAFVGVASCSGRGCHGREEPIAGQRIGQNEFTTWLRRDPHALAYDVLFDRRSAEIESRLAGKDQQPRSAHEDARCLACHTLPQAARDPELAHLRRDGVGCEACHGAARDWLGPHTRGGLTDDWRREHGLMVIDDRAAVVRSCVGCHVGAPESKEVPARDVNHDLIAAGHPQLTFELSTFLANMPPHWNEKALAAGRKPRQPDFDVRTWALGQVETAAAAADLLAWRADNSATLPWPELAEYDCYGCHHNLSEKVARPQSKGRWAWGTWSAPLLDAIPGVDPADREALGLLRARMQTRRPNPEQSAAAAMDVSGRLRSLSQSLDDVPLAALSEGLSAASLANQPLNWDRAEQLVLAAAALERARSAAGIGDPKSRKTILALLGELQFPADRQGPTNFVWDSRFRDELTRLFKPPESRDR